MFPFSLFRGEEYLTKFNKHFFCELLIFINELIFMRTCSLSIQMIVVYLWSPRAK